MKDIRLLTSRIDYLGECGDAKIYIKRDDKLPFSYGGNKVRIAAELIADMKKRGFTSIVSYGSPGSNMNRAIAHMAMAEGINCRVIMKKEKASCQQPLNEKLVLSSGAAVDYCSAEDGNSIREAVEAALEAERGLGHKPYYIYGNSLGQGNRTALMMASFKEYGEIRRWEREQKLQLSHIFLAVGTGATISGLVSGERTEITVDKTEPSNTPAIHGISVARTAEREREIILDNLYSFNPAVMEPENDGFDITDEYLCGGYGKYNEGIMETIGRMYMSCMLPLDPTYTGKAFYGMEQEIKGRGYSGNCLFIHTGGYPLFRDLVTQKAFT